ncbi:fatty acid desaturase [Archangium minus]
MDALASVSDIRKALAGYAVPDTRRGVMLFLLDLALFLAGIATVLFAPGWGLQVLGSLVAGLKGATLSTIGHDAAHNSFTRSRRLNTLIAVVSLLPGLFNYKLWVYNHHAIHHASTNGKHRDAYTPLSKEEYDALSPLGKLRERFFRAPSLLLFGPYFILERWWSDKFFPRRHMPAQVQRAAWPYFGLLVGLLVSYSALLLCAPLYSSQTTSLRALFLGLILPFFVLHSVFSLSVYLMHTHPRVPWFKGRPDINGDGRQELVTVHLNLPRWSSALMHNVFNHAAHHVHPAIPCYRLREAQTKLNEMLGPYAVSVPFSLALVRDIQRRCKLYDYENHRWIDFEGRPTTEVLALSVRREQLTS